MPHPHIPSREQADVSLDRFFAHLGHAPSSHRPEAPRLIRPVRAVAPRLIRERRLALWSRTLDLICIIALAAIALWVGLPVLLTMIAGSL